MRARLQRTRQAYQRSGGIPTGSVIFIVLAVAVLSFVAGTRADQYQFLAQILEKNNPVSKDLPDDLSYESVEKLYDVLRLNFDGQLTETQLLDGLKAGLAKASGDPYTVYLNQEQAKQFDSELNGTFVGIGAEIGKEDDLIVVVSPLKGFPAEKAGLRSGDGILKIDDQEAYGLSVEEAVLKIRGEKDTNVTLTILRDGKQQEVTITRTEIVVPSVEWEVTDDNIGYISLSRFSNDTSGLIKQAAEELTAKQVDGIILDLRNNGGGYLSTAVDVAGLWLDNKTVVEERENDGAVVADSLKSGSNSPFKDIPSVVLVNQGSASASEIVAGALKDYKAATLVGKTTFGKGSVQDIKQFNDGSELKVTIARWYTPNGNNIDKTGITPDVEVDLTNDNINAKQDPQRAKAEELLKKQ